MNIMTKRGSQDNVVTYEHLCDTAADLQNIDPRYITLGSIAIILQGTSGGLEIYIADSNKQWNSLTTISGGISGSDFSPDISNPQDGDTLVYDGTAGKWVNGAGGGGVLKVTESFDEQTSTYTLNKTWEEIYSAIVNGWYVPIFRHEEQGEMFADSLTGQIILAAYYNGDYILSTDIEAMSGTTWSANSISGYPSRRTAG